mmetsp:Transcript_30096/g.83008  ORF Transcript_30096/g.83008 Transcript_30096/m.83008 type:complete len:198 (-) Transcript_30096:60-653(-)
MRAGAWLTLAAALAPNGPAAAAAAAMAAGGTAQEECVADAPAAKSSHLMHVQAGISRFQMSESDDAHAEERTGVRKEVASLINIATKVVSASCQRGTPPPDAAAQNEVLLASLRALSRQFAENGTNGSNDTDTTHLSGMDKDELQRVHGNISEIMFKNLDTMHAEDQAEVNDDHQKLVDCNTDQCREPLVTGGVCFS